MKENSEREAERRKDLKEAEGLQGNPTRLYGKTNVEK